MSHKQQKNQSIEVDLEMAAMVNPNMNIMREMKDIKKQNNNNKTK